MVDSRILIVEDSPTQAEALRSLLEDHYTRVDVATNGEQALTLLDEDRYELILSDVIMPGMNGYELCHAVKARFAGARGPSFILVTSQNEPGDVVRGLAAGADNYITKPYHPESLLARIQTVLAQRAQRPRSEGGASIVQFLGETFAVAAERPQILSFLLAAFEDLVRTNRDLDESRRAAEGATRARDDMLATVSHDLRNPLGTIYTSAAMMLEMDLSEAARTQQIAIIHRTANRMMRLLEDLVQISHIEAGHFAVDRELQPVGPIIDDAIEMLLSLAADKGINVVSDVADANAAVCADRNRVVQAVSNLTANAIKFTERGGTIILRTFNKDDLVVIAVEDTGAGIAADHVKYIFDRFYQVSNKQRHGAGLGLAIVRGIADAHGGQVWVESELGRGSTFYLGLPAI